MERFNLMIGGSRKVDNIPGVRNMIMEDIHMIMAEVSPETKIVIIEGGAAGIDTLARLCAISLGLEYRTFAADWERFGDIAGTLRNEVLIRHADFCLFYWDGKSTGTKDAIDLAEKYGKEKLTTIIN